MSSVKKDTERIVDVLKDRSGCLVVDFNNKEINKYYKPTKYKGGLGPDRMAAALGSDVIYPSVPKMVVDIGTAMTIDIVDAKGYFVGGNISLGLGSRMKALAKATSKLPETEGLNWKGNFGEDTVSAIEAGARNGVVGEILYSFEMARKAYYVKIGLVTGGDASEIWKDIKDKLKGINDPYMVGRGLNCHLRKNYLHVPVDGNYI